MLQSSFTTPRNSPADDPLSAFDSEDQAAPEELLPSDSAPATPTVADTSPDSQILVTTLSAKLDQAAREIDRSNAEVATLRGELASIVAKIRDIERQVNQDKEMGAPKLVVVAPPRRRFRAKVIRGWLTAALGLLVLGAAILWRPAPAPSTIDRVQPIASPSVPRVTVVPSPAPAADNSPVSDPRPIPTRARNVVPAVSSEAREFLGTLAVQTTPSGADVLVNHKSVGKTPVRLPKLRAGSHLIWIELGGYQRWTRVVAVPADQVTNVSVQLERQ